MCDELFWIVQEKVVCSFVLVKGDVVTLCKNEKHGELRPKTASTLLRVEFHSSNTHTGHHDINLII